MVKICTQSGSVKGEMWIGVMLSGAMCCKTGNGEPDPDPDCQ